MQIRVRKLDGVTLVEELDGEGVATHTVEVNEGQEILLDASKVKSGEVGAIEDPDKVAEEIHLASLPDEKRQEVEEVKRKLDEEAAEIHSAIAAE